MPCTMYCDFGICGGVNSEEMVPDSEDNLPYVIEFWDTEAEILNAELVLHEVQVASALNREGFNCRITRDGFDPNLFLFSRCGETGHVAINCSKTSEVNCYRCGESGHLARECTIEATA